MKKKHLLLILLMALLAPWAANAQGTLFSEDFEDGSMPTGWTTDGPGSWSVGTGDYSSGTGAGHGSYNAKITHSTSSSVTKLITPEIDLSSATSAELSFMHVQRSWSGDIDQLRVYYRTSSSGAWTLLDGQTYTGAVASWTTEENIALPNISSTYQIAFEMTDKFGYGVGIDYVQIVQGASCVKPTGLAATLTPGDGTIATLSWTKGGEETDWVLEYSTSSTFASDVTTYDGSFTTEGTTVSADLMMLTPETTYYARVKADCGSGDESDWSTTCSFQPTTKTVIGSGDATSYYLPTYTNWKYSLTQQIYTTSELGAPGVIESIDFYSTSTAITRNLDIYIVSTTKSSFESGTDWITVTSADKVFSGSVTFSPNTWNTITLDSDFIYDGLNNIAIIVDDNSGNYPSTQVFRVFDAANQAIYVYNDNTNYDPTNPGSYSGTKLSVKNQIRILKGEAPSCMKPSGLAVEYTGGTTATVSWTSEASAWNMKVNGVDVAGPITNPYTLTGLELATDYAVTIQADCGETQSDWTTPVNFTTDECMNPVIVNYALTDAYGDGWNGASISVLDENDLEVANLTLSSGSSSSGTLKLCGYHAFVWNSGSYDDECSFTFTDAIAQPLASGTGDSYTNGEVIFTIGILTCPKPTNLAASEIFGRSAKLSWTENGGATEWVVAYKADGELNFTEVSANTNPFTLTGLEPETDYTVKVKSDCEVERWSAEIGFTTDVACPTPSNIVVTPTPFTAEVSWLGEGEDYDLQYAVQQEYIPSGQAVWLQYDNNTYATGIGSNTSGNWTWGVMYPASMLEGNVYLNKVGIYETATYYTSDYTVRIYSGGDDAPETLLGTENVTPTGTNGIHEVLLSSPITIDPAKNLWIVLNVTGTYVLSACETTESNNQWVYDSGSWVNIGDLSASLDVYGWMIRGLVDNIAPEYDWTTKTNVESPYTITGLTPETTYAVRIKSNCGGDGNSEYSAPTVFTTPSNCTAPYDLEAEPLDENATLSWTGYQDKFNVRYRTAGYYDPIWEDNFENGLNQWTIIAGENAEAVGANAVWYANNPTGGLSFPAYSGDYCASSWSWNTNAYYANNWLITPQLDLQGVVKYYVRTNADYPDKYEVLLSTTTAADTTNFNVTLKAMATAPAVADWTEVIIDLKDYEGQQGYIAFHHLDYDMNYLLIDDFGIYTVTPAGAWTTLDNQDNPVVITTVAGTAYEWQVQGVYAGCDDGVTEWSESGYFTTYNQVYDDEEWSNGETTIDDDVLLIQDVIIPDGVVAYANSITLEPGAHLIIEDGGQLYTNEPVVATVQKELATPSKTAANWYTISSPANNIAPGAVTNLIQGSTDDYDLYLYNEPTTTWLNQKNDANIAMFANLTNGRGYLYWNSTGADLSFTGTLNVDDVNIALTKTGSDALAGFNLIGNPFSHNIYKGTGGAIESTKLAEGFYVLDNTGTWGSVLAYTTPIKPCQGILVQATESFNLTIANSTSPATGEKRSNDDNIMFVVNNSQFEDAAYALFNDGIGLTKINHRNADAPMLFIPQDGEDYAIATMGDDTETFGLNFKAMTTGMYTLSAKADGMFSYLHVIDRLTGEDIDMLVDGKYEFIGSPRDNEARFIVKLRYNANGFDNDEFIYQNGDELIVNGEGELQVYDVMGRYVASYNVNGNKRISAEQFSNAVYIFRLIGSDVKTQKIVVR